jgi:superoxide dismutase, Cu-Zn family
VTVGTDSLATIRATTPGGTLRGDSTALMDVDGAAVVLHSGSDDYRTDPAGASGNPIACGVVSG